MIITLIDGQRYELPDGTEVTAMEMYPPGNFVLTDATHHPQYMRDCGQWKRFRLNWETDAYEVGACDLTDDDLWPIAGIYE